MESFEMKIFNEAAVKSFLRVGGKSVLAYFLKHKKKGDLCIIKGTSGTSRIIVDGVVIFLKPNEVLALSHNYSISKFEGEFKVLHFNKEFYCIQDHDHEVNCAGILFYNNQDLNSFSLEKHQDQYVDRLFCSLFYEFDHLDRLSSEMFRSIVKQLIILLTRIVKQSQFQGEKETSNNDLLRHFNILVEENYKSNHAVSFYAEQLFRSPKTLSNSFKKFNTSPLQIIHHRIIQETKRFLMYSDKNLKEIAFELGFNDPSNLGRIFRKEVGSSMSEFKNQFLQERDKLNDRREKLTE